MNTEFLIIRHGQSIGNEKRIFLGHTDLELTPLGYHQAELTAEALRGEKIDEVYSSDLIRAYNTALPNAKIRDISVKTHRGLREIFAGAWEGKTVFELEAQYPETFVEIWRKSFGSFPGADGGGEAVAALAARIESALLDIGNTHRGKRIIVATHAAAIRAMWGKISKMTPEEVSGNLPFPENASVTRVEFDGERLIPKSYSESKHLTGVITKWQS